VSTRTAQLLAEIVRVADSELRLLGMRKTKGVVCPFAEDVSGWLGLKVATKRGDGRVGINPVVGIRREGLERMVAELSGRRFRGASTDFSRWRRHRKARSPAPMMVIPHFPKEQDQTLPQGRSCLRDLVSANMVVILRDFYTVF
jgi:hypothetical protein